MIKKKNKTFAQRAKDITKRYKRVNDPIETAALESKMEALKQEQENYKLVNGIEESDQMANGGNMYPNDYLDPIVGTIPTEPIEQNLQYNQPQPQQPINKEITQSPYKTSIAPSLISGATSSLGNLYLANQQKNIPEVNLPRISTKDISLEKGRQAAKRVANQASQKIKYATTKGARTRGELMANRAAGEAAVSTGLGETLSASHEKEALVNANMKSGMDRYNAEIAAKEEMINKANQIKNKKEREAYLAAAIATIPQMTKDINSIQAQDKMINVLGDKYGWYTEKDPNAPLFRKKSNVVKFRG